MLRTVPSNAVMSSNSTSSVTSRTDCSLIIIMNFFASIFNRDPLALFLGEFNINNKNNRRCDLLNRSRLVAYFDLNDGQGSKALLKIVELAS
jgi:hypothetical protein